MPAAYKLFCQCLAATQGLNGTARRCDSRDSGLLLELDYTSSPAQLCMACLRQTECMTCRTTKEQLHLVVNAMLENVAVSDAVDCLNYDVLHFGTVGNDLSILAHAIQWDASGARFGANCIMC
eukprot:1397206-Amphidinium_carterae.1